MPRAELLWTVNYPANVQRGRTAKDGAGVIMIINECFAEIRCVEVKTVRGGTKSAMVELGLAHTTAVS